MKTKTLSEWVSGWSLRVGIVAACILGWNAHATGFDVGSDGSLGDVVIEVDTVMDLPEDGVLHFRTLTVNSGTRLSFNRNQRNTPAQLLSQGDIVVDGTVHVNGGSGNSVTGGPGGPGGFAGGFPGFGADFPPGDGFGPGGGPGGANICDNNNPLAASSGSYGTRLAGSRPGLTYGNGLLIPLIGGSGGGGTAGFPGGGGGGGGGAILLASSTRIVVRGRVEANGGSGVGNSCSLTGGSGGAIRLVAFVVEGNGVLTAMGPSGAGAGRIRIDTVERLGIAFNFQGSTTLGANLVAIPPVLPKLSTIEAAGNLVPQGGGPVSFILPFGSSPERTVKLRAEDFGRRISVRVAITPQSGPKTFVDAIIDNAAANPAEIEVPITLPVNTQVTLHAWTQPLNEPL